MTMTRKNLIGRIRARITPIAEHYCFKLCLWSASILVETRAHAFWQFAYEPASADPGPLHGPYWYTYTEDDQGDDGTIRREWLDDDPAVIDEATEDFITWANHHMRNPPCPQRL